MATTTPENASDLYKSQITEIAIPSPVDKTAAKALIPQDGAKIYPQGSDGGVFIGGTNVAGYYNDNSSLGYGTKFKPSTGITDGTVGWERPYSLLDGKWFKAGPTESGATNSTAINEAVAVDKRVFLKEGVYELATEAVIPAGVVLVGESQGEQANTTPTGGTIFKGITSSMTIVRLTGAFAGLKDIAIIDTTGTVGIGLHLDADGNPLNTLTLKDVFVFGITGGTGVSMLADNAGFIAYSDFQGLRIRNCGVPLEINGTGVGAAFVSSNSFFGGSITGGGASYGLRARGNSNDNRFYGMSVEVSAPTTASISVEDNATIYFQGRLESIGIADNVPIVFCGSDTVGSTINGLGGAGLIIDRGQNDIRLTSNKAPQPRKTTPNLFNNSALRGVTASAIDGWTMTGVGVTLASAVSTIVENVNTLTITVPAGITATLYQDISNPTIHRGNRMMVGSYLKTATYGVSDGVAWYMDDDVAPISSGNKHNGDNTNLWLGHLRDVGSTVSYIRAGISIANTTGSAITVEMTMPVIVVGYTLPLPVPPVLNGGRAVMNGHFAESFGTTAASISLMILPQDGNDYIITGTTAITRINQSAADRFPTGSKITLYANAAGMVLTDGTYLLLNGSFTSVNQWDNITLKHIGAGVWVEIGRTLV